MAFETLSGDYSSLFSSTPVTSAQGAAGKTWWGSLAGLDDQADQLDWQRSEQSANNAFVRDMLKLSEQNQFNSNEAQKERDWSTEMSNTAYQRAVRDMKASGLNPVLAFQQGGASTPSGSTAVSGSGGSSGSAFSASSSRSKSVSQAISLLVSGALKLLTSR